MRFRGILIANRGEVAIRISRACADLGVPSVAIFSEDDKNSLHVKMADDAVAISGVGASSYLDIDALLQVAKDTGCDAIHPGYGFLSERADFAEQCNAKGITFIGPESHHLRLFGDKAAARSAAHYAGVPVSKGTFGAVCLEQAEEFFDSANGSVIIKALSGGGGRGTRLVSHKEDLKEAFRACQSEARKAFGISDVYLEKFVEHARHIEVQIIGDKYGNVAHLGDRECSVQRRNQKLVEIAPAPHLPDQLRDEILESALKFARSQKYSSLGTFEYLLDLDSEENHFVFIEANARLQVEHTVTEEVTGVDLVVSQIEVASGKSLNDLNIIEDKYAPRGFSLQARVNMERILPNGSIAPSSGVIKTYEPPSGPGIRTDGFGYAGYTTNTNYDSLIAKVIVHSNTTKLEELAKKAVRALSEFRFAGVKNNIPLLKNIISHQDFMHGGIHTRWIEEKSNELAKEWDGKLRFINAEETFEETDSPVMMATTSDPLALFRYDKKMAVGKAKTDQKEVFAEADVPNDMIPISAPMQGTIVSINVQVNQEICAGQVLAVMEAMKMEHELVSDSDGIIYQVRASVGQIIGEGSPIILLEKSEVSIDKESVVEELDLNIVRQDLQENFDLHAYTLDEHRHSAVKKRRSRGGRMPRENIAHLLDEGSFKEYWPLVVARQHQRHDMETLRTRTPADGVVVGTGTINANDFGDEASAAVIVHYDYTVLAGTQGGRGHYKQDRIFELALRFSLPVVLFSEGGGGRPGEDNIGPWVAYDTPTFTQFSKLSGAVPLVGINHGRCFAGNTVLLACCDVIIATKNSTIGMGGPAMIEGGGLGVYTPEEVGPMSFQVPNGVVDILVEDEKEAVEKAKRYISYFQGNKSDWTSHEQLILRHIIPENRLRLYDMRKVIEVLADEHSVLEIREKFGIGIITALVRIEGRPIGVIANNPHHLSGAIDSDGADKGARFLKLCDAFDLPVLSLMDCPGLMVGPEVEATGLVRHAARLFNVGANLTVPLFGVVVRKAYGLGIQAMHGGGSMVGFFSVAWPTAEFAAMNIEGAVKLGYRSELAAIEDTEERSRTFDEWVAREYQAAKAVTSAVGGGVDDVIDPAETRGWIVAGLKRIPVVQKRTSRKYPHMDPW